jgi:6-phosphogluconolactonase (cycloisomerase 2 family)
MFAYTGCYTTPERHGRGDGIHGFRFDPATASWTHLQRLDGLVNPSFLIAAPDGRFLYSAHGDGTYATAYGIDRRTGLLSVLGQAETGGRNGVHLALSHNGRFLALANYASGSVAILPVHPDGKLGNFIHRAELTGAHGPNPVEQTSSHPHQVVFDPSGRFLLVPDKGLDRVFVFRFNETSGALTPASQPSLGARMATRPGSGPRHLAFHPRLPVVWVLHELNSTVTACSWNTRTGATHPVQELSTLPDDFKSENTAAEIAVSLDGKHVYCSNRGHDSIAVFPADAATGRLSGPVWTPSGGKSPRYIGFDPTGTLLFAANEQGDNIATFHVDTASGALKRVGDLLPIGSAVTIALISE